MERYTLQLPGDEELNCILPTAQQHLAPIHFYLKKKQNQTYKIALKSIAKSTSPAVEAQQQHNNTSRGFPLVGAGEWQHWTGWKEKLYFKKVFSNSESHFST